MIDFKKLTVLSATLVASTLVAQESVGTVLGSVRDAKGNPVASATIVIKGAKILGQRVLVSSDKGEFRIALLPPGDYTMNVAKEGWVGSRAEFHLYAGQTLRQNLGMKAVEIKGAEVEVVATTATVDKTETKTSTNITLDTLQALPMGLNSYAAMSLAPGVTGSTSTPVVRGGLAGQTQFTVNGISVLDGVVRQGRQYEVVIDDMTEDVSVIQSPLNAKLGNASGGVVNLVTKSGTNEFQGSMRVKLSKDSWSAGYGAVRNRYPTYSNTVFNSMDASTIASDDLQRTYEVSVLGPIIKDHLTFAYAARFRPTTNVYEKLENLVLDGLTGAPYIGSAAGSLDGQGYLFGVDPTTGASVVVHGPQKTSTQQYKLFWMVNQSHQVEFFYTDDSLGPYFDTQSGNIDSFAAFQQKSDRTFAGINYRGIIGGNGVIDVRYGKRKSEVNFSSGPNDPIYQRVYYADPYAMFGMRGIANYYNGYSAGNILSNGDTGSLEKELRQSETASVNYNWFNGSHNIDVGAERLKQTAYLPDSFGPNHQVFYSPARLADGRYIVFNYANSYFANPDPGVYGTYQRNMRAASGWIPEWQTSANPAGYDNFKNYDTTTSLYINDLWTLNKNWSVMGGVRWDQWKVEDAEGTRVKTSAFSPRFEVKWDLFGDVKHLMNFSYGQFRGTIGQGNLGGVFARRPGQIVTRNFWSAGSANPANTAYLVDKADFLNPNNYSFYTQRDSWKTARIDPDLKPEVAHEFTLGYKRSFEQGGFFRATAIYRKYKDLWYREGINAPVAITPTVNGFMSELTIDPQGKREYKGLEFEWQYPVLRSGSQSVDFQGSWTINRTYSRDTWREGNVASSAARFISEFAAAGIPVDNYNPYGQLASGNHNVLKAWLTWNTVAPNGVRNTVSLLGRYISGSPYSLTNAIAVPATLDSSLQDMNTSYTNYYNGRGRFTQPDVFSCDLQWNVTIPIKGKLQAFTYFSINNLFNTPIYNGIAHPAYSSLGDPAYYRVSSSANSLTNYGRPNSITGLRSVNVDLGIRF